MFKQTLTQLLNKQKRYTISDFLKEPMGKTFKLFVLHRISISNKLTSGKVYDADTVFKKAKWTFKKTTDSLLGAAVTHPKDFKQFLEFHVKVKNIWYPLQNGYLRGVHWTKLRKDTQIGFRGPMVKTIKSKGILII